MALEIVNPIIILLATSLFCGVLPCKAAQMDDLVKSIQNKVSPYKVNVVVESPDQLSPFGKYIAMKIHSEMPSQCYRTLNMSSNDTKDIRDSIMEGKFSTYGAKRISEQSSLTIGILEPTPESDILHNMMNMLENFISISPLTRGKYLIHLIAEEKVHLEQFFRAAWLKNFLDLTVIQWASRENFGQNEINGTPAPGFTGYSYSYDPFKNILSQEIWTEDTELFPDKMRNLEGLRLIARVKETFIRWEKHAMDRLNNMILEGGDLLIAVCEILNCDMDITFGFEASKLRPDPHSGPRIPILSWPYDFRLPISDLYFRYDGVPWDVLLPYQLSEICIPTPIVYHLYLMRPKSYYEEISFAAIVAFGGLFFTAFIFAVWAQFLGFRARNWSFLNILTAQMGGSIELRGPMKLSEMIFQMSIYVATFIVVTLGSDYMFQIFVLHQKLPEIKTIQDLADLKIDLIMDHRERFLMSLTPPDRIISGVYRRTQKRIQPENTYHFCELPRTESSVFDETINLCLLCSNRRQRVMKSNSEFQVDKIRDPVYFNFPILSMKQSSSVFKLRFEEVIYKFMEVGMLKKLQRERLDDEKRDKNYYDLPIVKEMEKDDEVPLQNQLRPIFLVGCSLAFLAFLCELIWKRYIEKTEFGLLVTEFYSDTRQNSAEQRR